MKTTQGSVLIEVLTRTNVAEKSDLFPTYVRTYLLDEQQGGFNSAH